ncbi:uncharacterized protein LOC105355562 isoform X2 [Oryzias latipes]|uniref:uncharacterized protein LOC105355562 isoform X2 n=1 Tax=Oryzias latipes TaxID=8090 RepID=UPI0005CC7842|nr:uncharacterized protein LOC105355562 isoform X2 [Oryzias latipes]
MIFISLITAALLTGSSGKGFTECSFNESGETLCFAVAGKSRLFYLLNTDFVDMRLLKDGTNRILKTLPNGSVQIYTNTASYFKNGTIKLNNVSKKDAGTYMLEEFNSEGKVLRKCRIHLNVLAPVSVLTVSQQCLSPEQQKVTCFYEGDEAELTLSLNGFLLLQSNKPIQSLNNDTSDRSSVFNVSIILHGHLLGDIMCKVWNNVSRDETVITLTACNGPQLVFVAAVAAVSAVVLLLVFAALTATLRKLCKKQRAVTVNAGDNEAAVIYTEVKGKKGKRKTEARLQDSA